MDDLKQILLDLKMPQMDGIQVLRQIKADEHIRLIPVVVLISSRESLDLEACYRLGANAYVVKPVRFIKFIEAVKGIGVFYFRCRIWEQGAGGSGCRLNNIGSPPGRDAEATVFSFCCHRHE